MSDSRDLLVLVDGSSFLYRAYHALPALTNRQGDPTGAVFGVANMLRRLLESHATPFLAVIFDAPGPTFRDAIFERYKAHRPPMPDDLRAQRDTLLDLIPAMGLPLLMERGVEADDVIGTLACQAAADGFRVVISTGDKDMAQLVNDAITLENTMSNTRLDAAGVLEKFGVHPAQIVDYLALVGDSSDNIPGVPKVGPKTAAAWLGQFGTLEQLIANSEQLKGKVKENLLGALEQLPMARELATIRCDVPLQPAPRDLRVREPDRELLRPLLERLGFSTWLKQLDTEPGASQTALSAAPHPTPAEHRYECVTTHAQLDAWIARLAAAELFAFDTETSSLDYMQAEIVGVSFAVEPNHAAYVPLRHAYLGAPEQLDRAQTLEALRPLLEDAAHGKLGQHLKYDANVLANHGIALRGIRHDTMLESYVLNSVATRHDMDSLAEFYLQRKTIHYEDVAGKGAKQIPFAAVAVDKATEYAAEDADVTLQLHRTLWPKLAAQPRVAAVYQDLEIPLVPVLSRMERTGVLVDPSLLERHGIELEQRIRALEAEAHELAGSPFNLGSPKQIQSILYDKLGIPVTKKTPTGQPSTSEDVLAELAATYDIPRVILEHRSFSKLRSTYTERLREQINPRTGRVHTSYHQAVAATGRLSSSDPNLQNIPIRTDEGRKIRQAFIAPPGYRLLAADYSQIELRIMAHLSEDESLLSAFAQGADVHRFTAGEVFGIPPEAVTADQRRSAKAINFGLIYGMSAFGLAQQLGIERGTAQAYIDLYFARYPGVKRYMDTTRDQARSDGYVETLFGRRLYVPEIQSRNNALRQYAERTAINAPMQGTAADIIKRAMVAIDAWIEAERAPLRMIMQVHDELVFEVEEAAVEQVTPTVRRYMSDAAALKVPLEVDIGSGPNWDAAH